MTGACVLVLAVSVAACAHTADEDRVAGVEARVAVFDDDLAATEARVHELSTEWSAVRDAWDEVAHAYESARVAYHEAKATSEAAASTSSEAARQWEAARRRWELYQRVIEVANKIDKDGYRDQRGTFACAAMSIAAFRRLLASQGIDVQGFDVDHIVPRAIGGVDHPGNYQLLPASVNRSLGGKWNLDTCAAAGADVCGRAIAVSSRCGSYRGPWF